jgi:hypothetical protein
MVKDRAKGRAKKSLLPGFGWECTCIFYPHTVPELFAGEYYEHPKIADERLHNASWANEKDKR